MHVFLTGDIQVGKTTIIQKVLSRIKGKIGGFETYFGSDRGLLDRYLYMSEAGQPRCCDEEHAVVRFRKGEAPSTNIERFDICGTNWIKKARQEASIIVMDECGNLENEAHCFQREIRMALNGETPILGVVKQNSTGWTKSIRDHERVILLSVTKENREALPDDIIALLGRGIKGEKNA
ncbi:MAG: nucleoside-triphosphatase [Clostridiales bacterium]|nr:nucleoside-triphosphatase [Clostridiales bacterium]